MSSYLKNIESWIIIESKDIYMECVIEIENKEF